MFGTNTSGYIPGWSMTWDPYYYFQNFEAMVNSVFMWIIIGFAGINVILLVLSLILALKQKVEFFHFWGLCLCYSVLGLIAAFALASMGYSVKSFFEIQEYNVFEQYYSYLIFTDWFYIVMIVIVVILAIVGIFTTGWGVILVVPIGAGLIGYAAAFVLYAVVYYLWMLIRMLYVVLSVTGFAMYRFSLDHWIVLSSTIAVPAVLGGLFTSLSNYYRSFRSNVEIHQPNRNLYALEMQAAASAASDASQSEETVVSPDETTATTTSRRRRHS